jgi:hypothetical protein
MSPPRPPTDSAELVEIDATRDPTAAQPDECLYCYLLRMLYGYGCDGTRRFTRHWADAQRWRPGWLLGWARRRGGDCDCEIVTTVLCADDAPPPRRVVRCAESFGPGEAAG